MMMLLLHAGFAFQHVAYGMEARVMDGDAEATGHQEIAQGDALQREEPQAVADLQEIARLELSQALEEEDFVKAAIRASIIEKPHDEQDVLNNALCRAAREGKTDEVMRLLGEGAQIDVIPNRDREDYEYVYPANALLLAAKFGMKDACVAMIGHHKKMQQAVIEILWCLKMVSQQSPKGKGSATKMYKILRRYVKEYCKKLYGMPLDELLSQTYHKSGLRPCELLRIDCLVPPKEFSSLKGFLAHMVQQVDDYRKEHPVAASLIAHGAVVGVMFCIFGGRAYRLVGVGEGVVSLARFVNVLGWRNSLYRLGAAALVLHLVLPSEMEEALINEFLGLFQK